MISPLKALMVGGAAYGCGVYYMTNYYYQNSEFKKIYLKTDPAYATNEIRHHNAIQ